MLTEPSRLADCLVTNSEWMEFIEDGGYTKPLLWLSEGWAKVLAEGWSRPFYWETRDGQHWTMTLRGVQLVDPTAPVVHVSYFEADVFATWSGKRPPSERRAEARFGTRNFLDLNRLRPKTASPRKSRGVANVRLRLAVDAQPVLALPALRRGRRVQWQVHVRAVRFARRLLRDPPGHLRGATAISSRRTRVGNSRDSAWRRTCSSSAIGETKGETR